MVPGLSMILPGTIPETPISREWSRWLERPPDYVLYSGRPDGGFVNSAVISFTTRMHSSRMRTGRSLTLCCSLLPGEGGLPVPGGGVLPAGGVCLVRGIPPCQGGLPGPGGSARSRGVPPWSGGFLPGLGGFSLPGGGVCLVPGAVPLWSGGVLQRPPLLTESQTRVKT